MFTSRVLSAKLATATPEAISIIISMPMSGHHRNRMMSIRAISWKARTAVYESIRAHDDQYDASFPNAFSVYTYEPPTCGNIPVSSP
ncbi:MAG: hypothetical protein A4E30_01167 [Methanomassiliicoccales archaeon PtaB.Bin215]|nr:MAG: hypothetical protein A4E30_01167 [Methanomassiliicoccales archaeon PtaB.Bin215]